MRYWITTHYPVAPDNSDFCRHVYLKEERTSIPEVGDIIFVRESETIRGKKSAVMIREHQGVTTVVGVGGGNGGIVGGMAVKGGIRPTSLNDVCYSLDGEKWTMIVECEGFKEVSLPRAELMCALGYEANTPPRFLDLWQVPLDRVPALLLAIDQISSRQ